MTDGVPIGSPDPAVLVIIPTYDERLNVERIVAKVRAAVPHADILVVGAR